MPHPLKGSGSSQVELSPQNSESQSWRAAPKKWQPTPEFWPGKSHGLRSLVGYSPWGCKELDTTERLHSLHSRAAGAATWSSLLRTLRANLAGQPLWAHHPHPMPILAAPSLCSLHLGWLVFPLVISEVTAMFLFILAASNMYILSSLD